MNIKYIIPFFVLFIFVNLPENKSQKSSLSPYQEYLVELKEYRKTCRNALKPYRYDGSLTTHFSYKEYVYEKEIEISTIQDEEYRLSFNAMGVKNDGINIKVYDKPKKYNSRTLLYEKDNVSGSEFTVETTEMLEKLIESKRTKGFSEEVLSHLRLKKLYIDYLIPATEREMQVDEQTGQEYKIVTKGAIILAVGYHNL
jgi:hypothetical protein